MNSFVSLHIVNHEFYNAMRDARDSVALQVGDFTSKFSPTVDPTAQLKIILDIIGLGFALVAAPTWSSCMLTFRDLQLLLFSPNADSCITRMKSAPLFKNGANGNTLGTIKDSVNPMVASALTINERRDASVKSGAHQPEQTQRIGWQDDRPVVGHP